uniref:Uncharacterized protein n=1 Tax=Anguilla anguilla TaxID=7936 RepID=A0A0E9W4U4_ANGAN
MHLLAIKKREEKNNLANFFRNLFQGSFHSLYDMHTENSICWFAFGHGIV